MSTNSRLLDTYKNDWISHQLAQLSEQRSYWAMIQQLRVMDSLRVLNATDFRREELGTDFR